jgi:hypothetical protein
LARLRGDAHFAQREIDAARRLYAEMGATAQVERLAKEMVGSPQITASLHPQESGATTVAGYHRVAAEVPNILPRGHQQQILGHNGQRRAHHHARLAG